MDMQLFTLFCVLSIVNVIIQTIKSICTIKCGTWVAGLANFVAYGINPIMVVLTVCELPLITKCIVSAITNLIGVVVVKTIEKKLEKDKLWKVEVTVRKELFRSILHTCQKEDLNFNYIDINKYYLFNFYCPTKEESIKIKSLLKKYDAKYFAIESQRLI